MVHVISHRNALTRSPHRWLLKLCTGGTVIDRVTIERSLLDNEINPFSREPMTTDDLVPDDELKARIQKWVAARKAGVPFEE
jgi:hypothetical protein